jgi:3',5'-cyclic AMP phosphodiesterase CpdA
MKQLAHISDLHFGRTDPAVVDGLAAELGDFAPDLCVVTGDITQRARSEQFEEAQAFLRALPFPLLVVPGNHDIAPPWALLARLSKPYSRYQHYLSSELDCSFVDDELLLIGLNTVQPWRWKAGRVSRRQVDWIESLVRRYPQRFHALAAHHPIVDVATLDRLGIELVLTGHLHRTYNGPAAQHLGRAHSVLLAQASTATSTRLRGHPNGYNRVLIDGRRVLVDHRAWDGQCFVSQAVGRYRRVGRGWQTEADLRLDGPLPPGV